MKIQPNGNGKTYIGPLWKTSSKEFKDFPQFLHQIRVLANQRGFAEKILGKADKLPILLLTRQNQIKPNILVSAGFHGEEPGGCFGVLHFLKNTTDDYLDAVNISILPIVNPTGIKKHLRRNELDEQVNAGFVHKKELNESLSRNGKILLKHSKILLPLAKDGFISLHEDNESDGAYVYIFEKSKQPGPFSLCLRNALASVFKMKEDTNNPDIGKIRNGIVFKKCDGTYEDFLFHKGSKFTACIETPSKYPMKDRAEAHKRVIESFVKFVSAT